MDVKVEPGSYVVAVSGGVDSVALLHVLASRPGLRLTVAHFDHGIRADSAEDRRLVQGLAKELGLPFVYHEGHLGSTASEAEARSARYAFLRQIRNFTGADAILTAHHQDDVLETTIHNIIRGTNRKGLSSLRSHQGLIRPFLGVPKIDIITYAQNVGLEWREDSTNQDHKYARNYIRHRIMPRIDVTARQQLYELVERQRNLNDEIDTLIANMPHQQNRSRMIDRRWFTSLPHDVSREVLAAWLRSHGLRQFDKKLLERLSVQAKTARPGSQFDVLTGHTMHVKKKNLALTRPER